MICTFGPEGIRRVASGRHPRLEGVEYLVAWQLPDGDAETPPQLLRPDFRIVKTATRGLSRNRNVALAASTAPLLLVADDDLDYTEEGLRGVMNAFRENPDCDILTFRYGSALDTKKFSETPFPLDNPARGYYVSSFEMAFRSKGIRGKVWFNENFGIGSGLFPCGEEQLFLTECMRKGMKGRYLPLTICRHEGETTTQRAENAEMETAAKGAAMLKMHPATWPMRFAMHLLRQTVAAIKGVPGDGPLPPPCYAAAWIKGVALAVRRRALRPTEYAPGREE